MHHFIVVFFIFLITLPAFKDYWLNILILKFGKKKLHLPDCKIHSPPGQSDITFFARCRMKV